MSAHTHTDSIPSYAIKALLMHLEDKGIPLEAVCQGVGYTAQQLLASNVHLSRKQFLRIAQAAMSAVGDPLLGLKLGSQQRLVSWGLAGFGIMVCETMGEAMEYGLAHQIQTGSAIQIDPFIEGDVCGLIVHAHDLPEPLERFFTEEAFSSHVAIGKELMGPQHAPLRVELRYKRPKSFAVYRQYMGCEVVFSAHQSRLVMPVSDLALRVQGAHNVDKKQIHEQIDLLLNAAQVKAGLTGLLQQRLRFRLDNPPTLQDIGESLHLSPKTVARKLKKEGTGLSQLVSDLRMQRAQEMLIRTDFSMTDIALELGFSDFRSFKRFFKHHSGCTPQSFKRSHLVMGVAG